MSEDLVEKALIEVAKERSKDIYDDGLKPATKEGGEALEALVGLFNNVVLYPVKKANITYKYKLSQFEHDMKLKNSKIPKEKLIEPPLTISGPTFEALKYTFDTEELREMYLNLLSSAMNIDTVEYSHPGYVDIIKQMSPLDANIFKKISKLGENIACARIDIGFDKKVYTKAMPNIFAPDLLNDYNPFLVSSSIANLCRLGLMTHLDNTISGFDYNSYKEHPYVVSRFEMFKEIDKTRNLHINVKGNVLIINDFGKNFAKVCL
ncbi:conserved hypothetical protein [Clostridium neonatale]|uniref:DUF4393 domain-containing protein n=1 Tax=Clostridium neonatale TaxID=137838 RepID=UPI00291B889E|nr:DUF4393 domain-containing protein [Clostridium neonatale]CAI3227120.1 conserved hypothetical protein [Clostridium neonatale]